MKTKYNVLWAMYTIAIMGSAVLGKATIMLGLAACAIVSGLLIIAEHLENLKK